jgi:cysteine desulfurase/selenocysteine lyase
MFGLFNKNKSTKIFNTAQNSSFAYLKADDLYFDNACQTLRPQVVIDAEVDYYQNFNACGGRVKYPWGQKTDRIITETRQKILKFLGKSSNEYLVAFTLNTSYGINLILQQLVSSKFEGVITTDIEHNSVFLPTITWANHNQKPRYVVDRNMDGSVNLDIKNQMYNKAIFIANTTSNIDGRELINLTEITDLIQAKDGIVMLDACQTLAHNPNLVKDINWDVLFGSGHKMYGPSIGFMVIKKNLLENGIRHQFIGGGMVNDVGLNSFELVKDQDLYGRLELGLQNFAGIVALGATFDWLNQKNLDKEKELANTLFESLKGINNLILINHQPTPTLSFYSPKLDGHQIGLYLAEAGIMTRTGYFCCHYYLKNKLKLPPLVRISAGLNNTEAQVDKLLNVLSSILKHR